MLFTEYLINICVLFYMPQNKLLYYQFKPKRNCVKNKKNKTEKEKENTMYIVSLDVNDVGQENAKGEQSLLVK
jgi:hypothetical protein